jgi:hypothetical protein
MIRCFDGLCLAGLSVKAACDIVRLAGVTTLVLLTRCIDCSRLAESTCMYLMTMRSLPIRVQQPYPSPEPRSPRAAVWVQAVSPAVQARSSGAWSQGVKLSVEAGLAQML